MHYEPLYWIFESEIPGGICDQIIEQGRSMVSNPGQAGGEVRPEVRKSDVSFFEDVSWVSGICEHYIRCANRSSEWDLHVDYIERPQFTIYGSGQYYDWHFDTVIQEPVQRKLSMIVQLTEPDDYEGGELMLKNSLGEDFVCEDFMPRGSVVVFPSLVWHQVTPVTKGVRFSLVCWAAGPKLR